VDLDEVAEELYAVPPDEFVAVRKQRQDDARAAGARTLAREIGALPKPTAAAWVCNLLVREQRAAIEGLVELGDLLRQAQESLAGDQLCALDRQRSQLLTALTRQATALAREQGMRVGGTVEAQVADTLRAAMADPEAGEAVAAAEEERSLVDDLDARRADLQARVEELADELARTEQEAAETAEELKRAERHRRTAERHATEAAAARDRALAALRALEEG
jgi:hypothetical protein